MFHFLESLHSRQSLQLLSPFSSQLSISFSVEKFYSKVRSICEMNEINITSVILLLKIVYGYIACGTQGTKENIAKVTKLVCSFLGSSRSMSSVQAFQ